MEPVRPGAPRGDAVTASGPELRPRRENVSVVGYSAGRAPPHAAPRDRRLRQKHRASARRRGEGFEGVRGVPPTGDPLRGSGGRQRSTAAHRAVGRFASSPRSRSTGRHGSGSISPSPRGPQRVSETPGRTRRSTPRCRTRPRHLTSPSSASLWRCSRRSTSRRAQAPWARRCSRRIKTTPWRGMLVAGEEHCWSSAHDHRRLDRAAQTWGCSRVCAQELERSRRCRANPLDRLSPEKPGPGDAGSLPPADLPRAVHR
jgi:hypothetical protein